MTSRQYVDKFNLGFVGGSRVLSVFNLSPKCDHQIFRTACIHSAAILFVIVCGACAIIVYYVLEPFLHSIVWSILAGAFLFPFKNHFTLIAREHLHQLDTNSCLLFYGLIILLPIKIFDKFIESIGSLCIRKWKQLLVIIIFLPSIEFLQSGAIYQFLTIIVHDYVSKLEQYIHHFDSPWIAVLVIIYIFAVLTIYNTSTVIKSLINIFSIPVWLLLLISLSKFLPANYRLIFVTLTIILVVIGYVVERNQNKSHNAQDNQYDESFFTNFINLFQCIQAYFYIKSTLPTNKSSSSSSTIYFKFIIWSFIAIKVYEFYEYLIPISIFIIIYKIIKYFLLYIYNYLSRQKCIKCILKRLIHFYHIRRDVLTPPVLRNITRFLLKGDKKINHGLQQSIDYLVSACMIITLFLIILVGSILLILQIRSESIHMIKLTSNLVNETIVLQNVLPDKEHMNHIMDKALTKLYLFGRNWIITQVAKVQPPRSEIQCCLSLNVNTDDSPYMSIGTSSQVNLSNKKLEEQCLQIWDRLYGYITNTSTINIPYRNSNKLLYVSLNQSFRLQNFLTSMQTTFDIHIVDLYRLVRDNLDLLRTILDWIWLHGTIILTLISTVISLLFTGGFALLNFFVSFIVFITLLFYLLSHSDQSIYKPTIWLNNILNIGGSGLGKTVHDVVTSVFIASIKIATFYGLYTYVLHTLLGSNFVFLPVVIAVICAVTLQSYWAALPGCLDLWLVQQRPLHALILVFAHVVPVYIVDTAIYSEVKGGGHQYLTALSIAGGVYYRGIEGALIGPIVLCCLLVGIRMYNETISKTLCSNHNPVRVSLKQYLNRSLSLQSLVTSNDHD